MKSKFAVILSKNMEEVPLSILSFFGEFVTRNILPIVDRITEKHVQDLLNDYIEFYNRVLPHSELGLNYFVNRFNQSLAEIAACEEPVPDEQVYVYIAKNKYWMVTDVIQLDAPASDNW